MRLAVSRAPGRELITDNLITGTNHGIKTNLYDIQLKPIPLQQKPASIAVRTYFGSFPYSQYAMGLLRKFLFKLRLLSTFVANQKTKV